MMEIKIPTRREWYPCPYCGQHLLVYADTAVQRTVCKMQMPTGGGDKKLRIKHL